MSKKKKKKSLSEKAKKEEPSDKKKIGNEESKEIGTQAVSRKAREHGLTEGRHSTQDVSRLSGHASL